MTIKEKKSKAYFRNFLSPVSDVVVILSSYVFLLIVIILQLALVIPVIAYFTNLVTFSFILNMLPLIFVTSTLFIFLGIAIGYIARSEEAIILINLLIILFFIFFSQTVIPHEMLAPIPIIKQIVAYSPFTIIENIIKETAFFHFSISKNLMQLFILFSYAIFFFLISVFAKKLTKRHLIYS